MATQAFIKAAETSLCESVNAVNSAIHTLRLESGLNDNNVYPENRDHWKTLQLNAYRLRRETDKLCNELDAAIGKL
jgi:hypothetical protein